MADSTEARVKTSDMHEDMQDLALKAATVATVKFTVEKDVAAHIKKTFDKAYGPVWQCIAGRSFASYVTYKAKHFIYFYLGEWAVLLYKTPP